MTDVYFFKRRNRKKFLIYTKRKKCRGVRFTLRHVVYCLTDVRKLTANPLYEYKVYVAYEIVWGN